MIRIGIICPSEIALRRFLPALSNNDNFMFSGISIANADEWYGENSEVPIKENLQRIEKEKAKANTFLDYCEGGDLYESYQSLIVSDKIDAVYLPLPPAIHYKWAKKALLAGKHVFVEKPSTTDVTDTKDLVKIAKENNLAVHENYMFVYHNQISELNQLISSGEIGDVRLYRITFGFPRRAQNDFRYNKALGGGALIDAGGYTIKYATALLGETAEIKTANLNYIPEFDVDIYGSATMMNKEGVTAQLAFGMDCDYRCEIEVWGSKGTITSNRILTAPAGFVPEYTIKKNQDFTVGKFSADDAFAKSIKRFEECIYNQEIRKEEYQVILKQSALVSRFKNMIR